MLNDVLLQSHYFKAKAFKYNMWYQYFVTVTVVLYL